MSVPFKNKKYGRLQVPSKMEKKTNKSIANAKKIYIVGNAFNTYRARAIINFFLSSPYYSIFYSDPRYLTAQSNSYPARIFWKGVRIFDVLINLYKIACADMVYLLPMAKLNIFEILFAKLIGTKIVSEFYISKFDALVNDRQKILPTSAKAIIPLWEDKILARASDTLIFLNKAEANYYLKIIDEQRHLTKSIFTPWQLGKTTSQMSILERPKVCVYVVLVGNIHSASWIREDHLHSCIST